MSPGLLRLRPSPFKLLSIKSMETDEKSSRVQCSLWHWMEKNLKNFHVEVELRFKSSLINVRRFHGRRLWNENCDFTSKFSSYILFPASVFKSFGQNISIVFVFLLLVFLLFLGLVWEKNLSWQFVMFHFVNFFVPFDIWALKLEICSFSADLETGRLDI